MEFIFLHFVVLMYCLQMEGVDSAMSLKQLSEKIDLFEFVLEKKLDSEIEQRQRDYENLMSKLGDITTQIETLKDKSSISANGKKSEEQKISVSEIIHSENSEELLKYLINGIKTKKKLNGGMRRDMSRKGRALSKLNTRVTREVSRVDTRMTDTYLKLEKQIRNFSNTIENGLSKILSVQNDTNLMLRNELELSTSKINSIVDDKVTESDNKLEERFNNLGSYIENGFSMVLKSQNNTRRVLRNAYAKSKSPLNSIVVQLEASTEQSRNLINTIQNAKDEILTTGNESQIVLHNELKQLIGKHSDRKNRFTECSNEELLTNMSQSLKEIHIKLFPFKSCIDAFNQGHQTSGVYNVGGTMVWCDQTTDSGGWTVFQRRMDGSVDFYRDWVSYKQVFGNVTSEFWLGNDYISEMLSRGNYELRIDMQDFEGNRTYAKYESFNIDPEWKDYALHVGKFSGNASDALTYHDGYPFSTKDMDLDTNSYQSCAIRFKGAWWYSDCYYSNLNGLYNVPPGLVWFSKTNPLKFVEMKFRHTDGILY